MESCSVNPLVVHMGCEELNNYQFLWPPPLDSTLLDVLEQFEDQTTDRLLLSTLEACEDPPRYNTIKEDKKTPAKMLPSTLCILVLYVKMYNLHFCCK